MNKVIKIARTWIGTPYHHQSSVKGVGCDCIGLIHGVYQELHNTNAVYVPSYSRDWGNDDKNEDLLVAARTYLNEIPVEDATVGSVLALRWLKEGVAKHAVILSEDDKMIHAYDKAKVEEVHMSDWWKRKIVAAFNFKDNV